MLFTNRAQTLQRSNWSNNGLLPPFGRKKCQFIGWLYIRFSAKWYIRRGIPFRWIYSKNCMMFLFGLRPHDLLINRNTAVVAA